MTLTGAGGGGKTRLGRQVAAELLDGSGDGVWLVELAAVANKDAVAVDNHRRAAGSRRGPAVGARHAAGCPRYPADVLIVLDNCEHLIERCAEVVSAILRSCPGSIVLATSREPLGIDGEAIYRVPSLSLPDRRDVGSPE